MQFENKFTMGNLLQLGVMIVGAIWFIATYDSRLMVVEDKMSRVQMQQEMQDNRIRASELTLRDVTADIRQIKDGVVEIKGILKEAAKP